MQTRRSPSWCGGLALAGFAFFALACVLAQYLRRDLDWVAVPPSFYLLGPGGTWLRAAYFVMAASLVVLGFGLHRSFAAPARSAVPWLLFVIAAAALCVTAVEETNTWAHPATLHGFIHGVAAQTTFLCVTVAMLLQSVRMRRDAWWRASSGPACLSAVACFAGLWVQALWRDLPRGASQKVLVLMILVWLAAVAWKLWRREAPALRTPTADTSP